MWAETKEYQDDSKMMEKLEKSFWKDVKIQDKDLMSELWKWKDKEKFDANELNEAIDKTLEKKVNSSIWNLWNNDWAKRLAELQKTWLMDEIRKENDPKKKIEMFEEITSTLKSMEWTAHAEMKNQEKQYWDLIWKEEKSAKEKNDAFTVRLKSLADIVNDARVKHNQNIDKQKKDARKEWDNEQMKSQHEANEVGEKLNVA
ncbi:MAG: hypothetical protein ACD_2C00208G0008 [uncultured bacterium (gcode 4)]|uniref:Uncharacterized protein n=1 Tax=uncultured bacterium (gcode 4) TaxID=1234023 RepID=K2G4F8_9BACT|nr:MAG: hypothetical protein ACD_2C00208G0008 [uncultured bacterium (gcode 4)]